MCVHISLHFPTLHHGNIYLTSFLLFNTLSWWILCSGNRVFLNANFLTFIWSSWTVHCELTHNPEFKLRFWVRVWVGRKCFQKALLWHWDVGSVAEGKVRDSRSLASSMLMWVVKGMSRLELFSENMLVCSENLN